ncbi:unnamed protein product [Cyprideis torosa]|uniref:Uncharacterized protein n=1 Tax=Cyprideis torosa TaxID=163714 RepID=A0A7R8WS56_9CRUS|nr:unnamed protein product [Cyprideis torosa]CAG0909214.1 unnamed protein product [Cyprideis torosa]
MNKVIEVYLFIVVPLILILILTCVIFFYAIANLMAIQRKLERQRRMDTNFLRKKEEEENALKKQSERRLKFRPIVTSVMADEPALDSHYETSEATSYREAKQYNEDEEEWEAHQVAIEEQQEYRIPLSQRKPYVVTKPKKKRMGNAP